MAIRIPEEAADFSTPVNRRRQEDGPTRLERLIGGVAVRHPNRQLMTDGIRIRRRRKGDCRLVPGGPPAGHQQQPAPLKIEHARRATILTVNRGSQHITIKMTRSLKIADHQQLGECNPFCGKFGLRHRSLLYYLPVTISVSCTEEPYV